MNKSDCAEWKRRPNINPSTNRQIKIGGPTYIKLAKDCEDKNPCDRWKQKPLINPHTGRTIKINGPTYKRLAADCGAEQRIDPRVSLECEEWKRDMTKDPLSHQKLVFGRSKFVQLANRCNVTFPESKIPHGSDFLGKRVSIERNVTKEIDSISDSQWDMCMTGKHSKFRSQLKDVVLLGYGSFGEVYKTKIGRNFVVIKEAYLHPEEKILLEKNIGRKHEKIPKNSYPREFELLTQVRQLIRRDICPNFLYAYDVSVCDRCEMSKGPGFCYITFMEPADGDLFQAQMSENIMISVLYQMLIAVHSLHSNLAIVHKDIKSDNFLVKKVRPGGWLKYTIRNSIFNETFYVENTGFIVLLSDFGISESIQSSHYSFTGTRNAKVVKDGSRLIFRPITCRKYAADKDTINDDVKAVIWTDGSRSTRNRTYNNIDDLFPNIPVDLTDYVKFPAFEFFYDVMDVIHMFTGGKRMLGPGNHHSFKNVPVSLLRTLRAMASDVFVYDRQNVKSIVAAEMLKTLYIDIGVPRNIIGEYQSI